MPFFIYSIRNRRDTFYLYIFNYSSTEPPEIIVNAVNPEWSMIGKYSDDTIYSTLRNCTKYIFGFTAEVRYNAIFMRLNNIIYEINLG